LLTSPHLHSPESQKRIDVWEQTHALRINLSAGRAMGVEIKRDSGETVTLGATDEIILCAGAIGTPWLLMNSGIGDERHLAELGIACHLHLPSVGVNLQDHLVYPVVYRAREPKGLQSRHDCSAKERYRQLGSGPLASNIAEAGALRGGEDAAWPPKPPDFQIHFTPTHYLRYPQGAIIDDCLTLGVTDLHPASRGMIRLQRNSSGDTIPHIDPGYLMAPIDETRLLEGLAWAQQIASSGPLSELIEENLLPGKGGCNLRWNAKSIRAFSRSIYHPVGTCRMVNPTSAGPLSASSSMPDGVVDTQFRVMGLSGLRIADASVIPDLPSCNTNSVVLGIAIRAAEALLNSSSQHDQ
jgi:choline dehydrogenase